MLQAIEEHALTPEAIEQVIALTERDDAGTAADLGSGSAARIARIARLVAPSRPAGDVPSLAARLRELEARKRASEELAGLRPVPGWRSR